MPRARLRPRYTGTPFLSAILVIAACVLHPITGHTITEGIAPTLSGLPAWGDGSKCVPRRIERAILCLPSGIDLQRFDL